jgi:hypothetical protein
MEYATLAETRGSDMGNLGGTRKKKGRHNGGSHAEDEYNKERNRDMRIAPMQEHSMAGAYSYGYVNDWKPSAAHLPQSQYTYNCLHGRHPGSVQASYGHPCPGCQFARPAGFESELQRGTFYLTFALVLLLLFDIGLRLQNRC